MCVWCGRVSMWVDVWVGVGEGVYGSHDSLCLCPRYDIRAKVPLKKIVMKMASNALCWNPMEAFHFSVANEDHNLYTFDMRRLGSALKMHEDHVSAVMALDYAPTGLEIVSVSALPVSPVPLSLSLLPFVPNKNIFTPPYRRCLLVAQGSYDRSVRIFGVEDGHSREVYHTKRMQRVFSCKFTSDNKYVLSGSDDTGIRLWKARASERIGTALPREQAQANYHEKLKDRFKHAPEVKRIHEHRHVPIQIKKAREMKHTIKKSETAKLKRIRAHSKKGAVPFKAVRKTKVISQIE